MLVSTSVILFAGLFFLIIRLNNLLKPTINGSNWPFFVIFIVALYALVIPSLLLLYSRIRSKCYRTLLNLGEFNPFRKRPRTGSSWADLPHRLMRSYGSLAVRLYGRSLANALREANEARHQSTKTEPIS